MASLELTNKEIKVSTEVSSSKMTTNTTKIVYRLPKNIKPYSYEITVIATFNVSTEPNEFDGCVEILFECYERTDLIKLHKKDIDINKSSIITRRLSNQGSNFIQRFKFIS